MRRKVLMITYYFPPVIYGSGIRVLNFAKYLTQYGWNSTVLTLNHSTFNALKDFTLSERVKESGIKVYAVNLIKLFSRIASANFPSVKREILTEILSNLYKITSLNEPEEIWKSRVIKLGEKILKSEKYNAIISFVPPLSTAQVGAHLSKKFKIPLIIDYSFIPNQKSPSKTEEKLLRTSHSIIVDNRKIKDRLLQNYFFLDYNIVKIIPTGFEPSELQNYVLNSDDKFTLTFSSGKIGGKKFKLVLNALAYLSKKEEIFKKLLLLNLIGIPTNEVLNLITKLQLKDNVRIYLNLNRENYIKTLLSSDFLIYLDDFDISNIPYDYAVVGKPYIAIVDGSNGFRYIIGDPKSSLIADINEPSSIALVLEKAFELFLNDRKPIPKINIENYDINRIIINLVKELENFVYD